MIRVITRGDLAEGPALREAKTRQVAGGPFHQVVDILRDNRLALVVCVKCGQTWEEADTPPACS